ncbi:MAG: DoxX family membrane protein [Chloroflexota bacterium]
MTLAGLLIVIVLGGGIGIVAAAAILGNKRSTLNYIWSALFGAIGAWGGSELFGSVSETGPEVEGVFLITAAIGAALLSLALIFGILRGEKDRQEVEEIEDPRIAKFLFNDPRAAVLWLGVRLYVGFAWFDSGWGKVRNDAWMDGGTALEGYWTRVTGPESGIRYGWFQDFIQYMLDNEWFTWFAPLIAIGEVLVGVALIVGVFVGIAAFFGTFMNFNFMLAGTASSNPVLFGLGVFLILAWKIAGWYGLDRYLLPMLGAPWKPGRVFSRSRGQQTATST